MKKYYLILASCTILIAVFIVYCKTRPMGNLPEPKTPVKWESIEEASLAAEKDGKMIFLDVYTDWCGWCKKMDKTSYRDTALIRILNAEFHPVRLNAEVGPISIKGKTYPMIDQFNKFSIEVLGGEMAFPATVILQPNMDGLFKQAGFMDARTLEAVTTFFYTKTYTKGIPLQRFVSEYK